MIRFPVDLFETSPREEPFSHSGSGLCNLTRNLGGAVGLALINTALNDRWDLHLARLHERFTWTNPMVLERLDAMARGFAGLAGDPDRMALKAMMGTVRIQGLLMSFSDVFLMLTALFLAMACATPLIRRPRPGAGINRSCGRARSTAYDFPSTSTQKIHITQSGLYHSTSPMRGALKLTETCTLHKI